MKPLLFIFLVVLFASCFNQGDCVTAATNLVSVSFINNVDGSDRETKFLKILELEDTINFLKRDSTYTSSSIQLPLNPNRRQTSFEFLTNDSVTYRLSLKYNTYTQILAVDCGAFLYFKDLSVDTTGTTFEHVRLINTKLLTGVTTNLELYF